MLGPFSLSSPQHTGDHENIMEFSFYVQNIYLETSLAFPLKESIFESVLTSDF